FSIYPDAEIIFSAGSDLCCRQQARCAIIKLQKNLSIIIQASPFDMNVQVGTEPGDLQPADIFRQVEGVGADIAHATANPALGGIGPPFGLLVVRIFEFLPKPALGIFNIYLSDFSQLSLGDKLSGLLDHRVAGIGMSKAKKEA